MKLEKGKAYYEVSFSTHDVEIPEIDTYIYIGFDLFNAGKGDHFFQSPWSYFSHGDFTKITDPKLKPKAQICVMPSEIVETLYSLQELIEYLKESAAKHPEWFGVLSGRRS